MNDLYIECLCGVSGDMLVGSLLSLGVSEDKLLKVLSSLGIDDEFSIKIKEVVKSEITFKDFDVILKYDYNTHPHKTRNIYDVYKILDNLEDERVKDLAKKIFMIHAGAFSKAHNCKIEEVDFHEAGAVDSIVDITSAAFCLTELNLDKIYVSKLYEGYGFIKCRKGLLSVPVPAVKNIVNDYNIPLVITDNEGEQITPTGAAIIAGVKTDNDICNMGEVLKTGYGLGKRYPDRLSFVKTMLLKKN